MQTPLSSDKGDGTGFHPTEPQFHSPVLAGFWNDGEAGDLALPARRAALMAPAFWHTGGRDYSCGTAPASPPKGALGRTTGLPLLSPAFRRGHLTGFKDAVIVKSIPQNEGIDKLRCGGIMFM